MAGVVPRDLGPGELDDPGLRGLLRLATDYDEAALFSPDGVYGSVNWEAIVLVATGTAIGWGLVVNTAASWLGWQGYLLGPLGGREGAWAGANLGVLAALLIGLAGHLVLGRGRVRTQEADDV